MSFWFWIRLGQTLVLGLVLVVVWRVASNRAGEELVPLALGGGALSAAIALAVRRHERRRQRELEVGRRIVRMPEARRRGTR